MNEMARLPYTREFASTHSSRPTTHTKSVESDTLKKTLRLPAAKATM
jgi:hypothetical protein